MACEIKFLILENDIGYAEPFSIIRTPMRNKDCFAVLSVSFRKDYTKLDIAFGENARNTKEEQNFYCSSCGDIKFSADQIKDIKTLSKMDNHKELVLTYLKQIGFTITEEDSKKY